MNIRKVLEFHGEALRVEKMSEMTVEELRKDLLMVNSPEFEKERPWLKAQMERILRDKLDQQQEQENREIRRIAQESADLVRQANAAAEAATKKSERNQVINFCFWLLSIAIGLAALLVAIFK